MNKTLLIVVLLGLEAFGLAAQNLPQPSASTPQEAEKEEKRHLGEEHKGDRRRWQLESAGGPWSPKYLQDLFDIAALQRVIFAPKFRLAPATRRNTPLPKSAAGRQLPPEPTWVNLGPTDGSMDLNLLQTDGVSFPFKIDATDSGRVSQIMADPKDPQTLFVAAAEGGLWKTNDDGKTWCSLTEIDSFPSLAIGAVALDPTTTPATIFIGLGDAEEIIYGGSGRGIVKSVDGGKTWSPKPLPLGDSRAVTSISINPHKQSIILVGTDMGLFRSTDAGKSYSSVALPNPTNGATTVRDIHWISDSKLILAVGRSFAQENGDGADVLVSTDDGQSWRHASGLSDQSIGRLSLAVATKNPNIVYALASDPAGFFLDIFKSIDGGETWAETNAASIAYENPLSSAENPGALFGLRSEVPQGTYDQLAIVDPTNPDVAYFGGSLNLIKTSDGGKTFRIVSDWLGESSVPYAHADFHAADFDASGHTLWIGGDGGLAKSSDGGQTWSTAVNKGLVTHLVYSISSQDGVSDLIAAGLQDNGTRVRAGTGSLFPQRLGGDGFDVLVHPHDGQQLLSSLYNTQIYKSGDGGSTMHFSSADIAESGSGLLSPFFTRIVPSPADPTGNTVFTFTNEKIYRSTDFADSWLPLESKGIVGTIRNFNVSAKDPSVMGLLVDSGSDRVLMSNDGGDSWNPAGTLPGNDGRLSFISFSPLDSKVVYVASRAPIKEAHHLWMSRDGGESWAAIDGGSFPTGAPVNVVVGDPNSAETIYAGTHFGLYRSQNGGRSWDRFGARLPFVSVTDIQISHDSKVVRIATFGRGIWELRPSAPPTPPSHCPSAPL